MNPIRFADDKVLWLGPEQPADTTVAQVATGVAKAVEGLINFPTVALQYMTGTTHHLGEIGSWSRFGSDYQGRKAYSDNPLTRAAEVANHMVFGTVDLVLAPWPYQVSVALGTQQYTPFFAPAPTTTEGLAARATNLAFLFALPVAGRTLKASLGVPVKAVPVTEGAVFKELAAATERAEFAIAMARGRARLNALRTEMTEAAQNPTAFNRWMANGERGAAAPQPLYIHTMQLQHFKVMIEQAMTNHAIFGDIRTLAKGHPRLFTAPVVSAIIQQLRVDAIAKTHIVPILNVVINSPRAALQSHHVTEVIAVMRDGQGLPHSATSLTLYNMAINAAHLFRADHIDAMIAATSPEPSSSWANYAMAKLIHNRPELFTPDRVARLNAANNHVDGGAIRRALNSLQKRLPR